MMNRFTKKTISLSLALVMLLGTLVGCGAPAESSTPTTDVVDSGEIEFWNFFTGPDGENMKVLVDGFNATNPKNKIKNVTINYGDLHAKIPTVVNAGTGIPDLVIVDVARVPMFQAQNLLENMNTLSTYAPELKKANYNEAVWNTGAFADGQYSIPLDIGVIGIAYNRALVAKYCPEVLSDNVLTLDEVKSVIPAAKADGIVTMPVSFFGYEMALSLITQEGGNLFVDESTPSINTPQMQKAITSLREIQELGGGSEDGEDNLQLFMTGGAIFCPDGIWDANALNKATDLDWGLTNSIAYTADKFCNFANSNQFVLLKNDGRSDEKEQSIAAFIDYVRANTIQWARSGMVPASVAANEDPEYKGMKQQIFVSTPEQASVINFNNKKFSGYANDAVNKVFGEIIFGRTTIEEGLTQAQKQAEDTIAQNK